MDDLTPTSSGRPVWTYFLLPGAIVIAAFLFSGKVQITSLAGKAPSIEQPKTGTIQFTVDDIKTWAKTIKGLDYNSFALCLDSTKYGDVVQESHQGGASLSVGGTPSFFVNGEFIEGAQPYPVFQLAIENALEGETPEGVLRKDITLTNADHIQGNVDAPVTVIEYSDFQCPFCRSFFEETYPQIKKNYIATGKIKFVYRHFFPIPSHLAAEPSARAVECASEQGKFWEMHDAIFSEQVK